MTTGPLVRRRMRRAPYGWAVLAVLVAVLALMSRGVALVVVMVAVTAERVAAVVAVVTEIADEYVAGRAGLPPLAGDLGRVTR